MVIAAASSASRAPAGNNLRLSGGILAMAAMSTATAATNLPPCGSKDGQCPTEVSAELYGQADIWGWLKTEDGSFCGGRYVEPRRDWLGADLPVEQAPLNASTDRSLAEGDVVEMTGEVQLRKGSLSVDAGNARYNGKTDTLWVDSTIVLRQPGVMARAESAELSGTTGLGVLNNAKFVDMATGTRVQAEKIERLSEQELALTEASYTQCAPGRETWRIGADQINLNFETGIGVARDSRVHINDTQILRLPYLQFPVDDRRMTGLLWPSIGTGEGGLDIAQPIYLNLAPHYDATLTPRLISEHGLMLEAEGRYLEATGQWTLAGAFLPSDDETGDDRWLLGLQKTSNDKSRWQSEVDFNRVSDDDYFRDLGTASLSLRRQTHLEQSAELRYTGDTVQTTLLSERFQTIADVDEPYRKLPELVIERLPQQLDNGLLPIAQARFSNFDHPDSIGKDGDQITGQRLFLEAGASLPLEQGWGGLTATVKARHLKYRIEDRNDAGFDSDPDASSALASLDGSLYFDRELQWRDGDYTQTLEPRAFALYAEHENQEGNPIFDTTQRTFSYHQLFRESRFSGYDRLDDANQIALGFSSSIVERDTGRELLQFNIGRIQYFRDRRTRLPDVDVQTESGSPFAAGVSFYPDDQQWLSSNIIWDNSDEQVDQFDVHWHRLKADTLLNLGYSFRRFEPGSGVNDRDQIEQVDASAVYPLDKRWSLYARLNYDIGEHRWLENLVGFEYQSCCWRGRLLFQRSLEPGNNSAGTADSDEAILFEIQLKGLGGLGNTLDEVLGDSIHGYKRFHPRRR